MKPNLLDRLHVMDSVTHYLIILLYIFLKPECFFTLPLRISMLVILAFISHVNADKWRRQTQGKLSLTEPWRQGQRTDYPSALLYINPPEWPKALKFVFYHFKEWKKNLTWAQLVPKCSFITLSVNQRTKKKTHQSSTDHVQIHHAI